MSNKKDFFQATKKYKAMPKKMTYKQKVFAREYVIDYNPTRAYKKAYHGVKDSTASVNASKLLKQQQVIDYIDHILENVAQTAGLSKLRVLKEHKKIAFSSIADLHDTWITRRRFEELTDEEKACIESIDTKVVKTQDEGIPVEVEHIKVKLYNKQNSLDAISKMLGYNEPEKLNIGGITKDDLKSIFPSMEELDASDQR